MKIDQLYSELHQFSDELLNRNKQIKLTVGGNSMFPLLKNGDEIVIQKCNLVDYKVGDIFVFKHSGKWVAHRLHEKKVESNKNVFISKGDSCKYRDIPVLEVDIIGKVTSFYRKGKQKQTKNHLTCWMIIHFTTLMTSLIRILLWINLRIQKYCANTISISKNIRFITKSSSLFSIINVVLSLVQGVLPFVIIYMIKRLIDSISRFTLYTDKSDASNAVGIIIIITGMVFLIQSILSIVANQTKIRLSQSISKNIFNLLHNKHASLDLSYFEDSDKQDKMYRALQEAGFRPMKIINEALGLVQSLVSSVIICVLLSSIHWSLTLILFLAIAPGVFLRFKHASKMHRLSIANTKKERELSYYSRILTGASFAKELRIFSLKEFFADRFNRIQDDLFDEKNRLNKRQAYSEIGAQCFAIAIIFISFGYVSYLSIYGNLKIGTVVMFFLIIQRGFSVMKDFFQSIAGLYNDNVYLNDFFDFLNLPNLEVNSMKNVAVNPVEQAITIENIYFKYPSSQRNALNSLSLVIPKGKTVALVGVNGSGKSTLIKLLCGFYTPDSGKIIFDDICISNFNSNSIRAQISAVFQDFALYNLSVNENISMGNIHKNRSHDDIKKAAKDAGIDEVVEALPLGYENIIGNLFEKGEELSMGQWQKIAIAKAFYRDAPILLLDEPLSALDPETELQILKKLKDLSKNKTTLIVSHRFATIQWVDLIYVMDNGTVIESGNHEQLMSLKGKYFSLFESSKLKF